MLFLKASLFSIIVMVTRSGLAAAEMNRSLVATSQWALQTRSFVAKCTYATAASVRKVKPFALMSETERQALCRRLVKPPKPVLTSAQLAFLHRIGLASVLDECAMRACLSHPSLPHTHSQDVERFEELSKLGDNILRVFVDEYVRTRFPRLPQDSKKLALEVFTCKSNLNIIAKSLGVDYAVIRFEGIPTIKRPTLQTYIQSNLKKNDKEGEKEAPVIPSPGEVYSKIFMAIIGSVYKAAGLWQARQFLDKFLFTASFNPELLCRPRNPMLRLATLLQQMKRGRPDYRLLHESGRISNSSIYVVGVYVGVEKLAEAHGPSLIVAQERAAVETLKKICLHEVPNAPRPSDFLKDLKPMDSRLRDLDHLKKVTKSF